MDSKYTIQGDSFHTANAVYQKIVPNVGRFIILIGVLALFWLGIGIYLTCVAGMVPGGNGERICYLNRFDKLWTELLLLLAAGLVYGGWLGYGILVDIAETAQVMPTKLFGVELTRLYRYGLFAAFGIYASMGFDMIWYSMVRRMRVGGLWKGSFLHFLYSGIENTVRFILRHKSSMISTLLPYNLFLFSNLAGMAAVYKLWNRRIYAFLLLLAMVAVDGIVGVLLSRRNAEQAEIEEGIGRIRDGEVEFKVDADSLHGSSRELAIAVNNIGEGIRRAVKTSMEDERLKTELITNVSHDLKTPLTSIISYVDLLKRLHIQEEPARGYIDILDSKAQRLKQLTDDLVEASRISSGSIELEKEKLNLTELLNQGIGEFSERLEESSLQVVFEDGDVPAYIYADSRRMWRVVENLFNNICKYAMEGTRVYVDLEKAEGMVTVSVKNISETSLNFSPDELTERFVRGDVSRSSEGSGLGLSIARNLTELQKGEFRIVLDGDLFKVILRFQEYQEQAGEDNKAENKAEE